MNTTKLIASLASLAAMIAVPGAATAYGGENEVEQEDIDADADQYDVIHNENDFYFYGSGESYDENAWTGANCQLIVVADAWIGAIAMSSALGVLDDSDRERSLLIGDLFPFQREGGFFDLDAESSTSSCDQSIGPVDIHVAADDGWDEPAPMGGTVAEAGEALAANRGGSENEIEQEDSEAESYQSDIINNENYADYEYLDESALASANCQAIIAAHVGVWSVAVLSMDATLLDTDDDAEAVIGDNGPAESNSVEGDAQLNENGFSANLTIDNDTTAVSSCAQPIESITISIGGRDALPPQS